MAGKTENREPRTVNTPTFSLILRFDRLKTLMQHVSPSHTLAGYEVVYNLAALAPDLYLPEAYIVSRDKDGFLAHIQQKALPETIGSFGLALHPLRKRLFQLIESMQPKVLEREFNASKRRPKPLAVLLEDPDIKRAILSYQHRKLDELLTAVVRHKLPITWEVERKVLVKDFVLETHEEPLEPRLAFEKTAEGVRYRLRLGQGRRVWRISEREVVPVSNNPGWLYVEDHLFRVEYINGNMIKPFRKKDEVLIPRSKVKTYFQRFILKVVAKTDIEAEGFDVIYHDELSACRLEPVRDLFADRWVLAVRMIYPGATFNWSDQKDKRTTLEFETEEIRIVQVRRDKKAESGCIDRLQDFELQQEAGSYFSPAVETEDPLFLLEWLAKHRQALRKAGFEVKAPDWEGSSISLESPQIHLESEQQNDWFDIYGTVTVGPHVFPFLKLAPNIRKEDPFYTLPDGQVFVIPQEWMTKYRALVQFGRRQEQHLRLQKSQYPLLKELGLREEAAVAVPTEAVDFQPSPRLRAQLRPYQLEGVRWLVQLYHNDLGGCLADDMGLGKTLQTIAVLLHAKEKRAGQLEEASRTPAQLSLFNTVPDADILKPLNALIILPASLVYNWEREIKQFAPSLTVHKHIGPKRPKDPRILARFDAVLTTYQTALRDVEILKELEHEYIVLDESQYIKNRESKIFRAINELNARHKISLSGTPIENSLSDLWSQMQFINPDLLGSFGFFRGEFIQPIEKQQNEEKKDRLRKLVAPYLLRRTKEAVAKDLPPLTTQVFYSEMSSEQRRLYDREKSAARNHLLENYDAANPRYKMQVLQSLTRLRQLANHPRMTVPGYERGSGKFQDVIEHWETIRRSGHKVLFFSFFVKYLEIFREYFEAHHQPYAWLTGDLNSKERERQIKRFEAESSTQAFFISIKSGGTGLNLTAADYVFILDPWWNPFTEQQAIARAHRIGQDKSVMALKFITKDSIEEKILRLQERKAKLAEDIIDNVRKTAFSKAELSYLLD